VLLPGRTPGFVVATPVGLFVGACFAALSSLDLEGAAGAALVDELRVHHQEADDMPAAQVAAEVAQRYGLVGGQGQVLQQVAEAIARLVDQQEEATRQRESIEQELRVAHRIQQQFLPHGLPQLAGWQIAAHYRPARAVGGDFYDFIQLPGSRIGIAIGDVTDKGVPAALGMATTHAVLRAEAPRLVVPAEVLQRANELLLGELPAHMFVTCIYAVLDLGKGRLRFANAGHCLPYLTADGKVSELHATGMPLGLMPGMRYDEVEQVIGQGGQLLLHSDRLTEAHSPG
jgi:serine phosphatase RsbU (regulator of sigma subunit)